MHLVVDGIVVWNDSGLGCPTDHVLMFIEELCDEGDLPATSTDDGLVCCRVSFRMFEVGIHVRNGV